MTFVRPKIVGIVNITEDSFSDGGHYLAADAAIAHGRKLLADGADIIELGAASSNPDATHVPAEVEIERLAPVIDALLADGTTLSADTAKPEVQRFALSRNVSFLNDIRGFPDESVYDDLARADAKLILMHSTSDIDKAARAPKTIEEVFASIRTFFDARLKRLSEAGIARERLITDPGMGYFLASNPEPSLAVLAHLAELKKAYGLPLMVCVSRKSFLKNLAPMPEDALQTRTLAAELFAAAQGVDYIRTHEATPLREGLTVWEATAHGSPGF